jgi:hypothetical protein
MPLKSAAPMAVQITHFLTYCHSAAWAVFRGGQNSVLIGRGTNISVITEVCNLPLTNPKPAA